VQAAPSGPLGLGGRRGSAAARPSPLPTDGPAWPNGVAPRSGATAGTRGARA